MIKMFFRGSLLTKLVLAKSRDQTLNLKARTTQSSNANGHTTRWAPDDMVHLSMGVKRCTGNRCKVHPKSATHTQHNTHNKTNDQLSA